MESHLRGQTSGETLQRIINSVFVPTEEEVGTKES
jgi:hypothetical protein